MRRTALIALAAGLLLSTTTTAARAATLVPRAASVATGADGGAAVAWVRADNRQSEIMLALRAPGATFGAPERVATDGPMPLGSGVRPVRVLRSDRGDVLVTWSHVVSVERTATTSEVWGRWRAASGAWSSPMLLSAPHYTAADVAMAPSGRAYVVYTPQASGGTQLRTALPGEPFSAPERVQHVVYDQELAATDLGLLLVGQGRQTSTPPARLRLARRTPSGRYTAVDLLGFQANPNVARVDSGPVMAASPDGTATVAWSQADGFVPSVRVATVPAAATAAQAQTAISGGSKITTLAAIGRDPTGGATILASQVADAFALTSTSGDYVRTDLGSRGLRATAFGADGSALALWAGENGGLTGVARTGLGTFAALPQLGDPGSTAVDASAAAGPNGGVVALVDGPGHYLTQARLLAFELRADGIRRTHLDAVTTAPDAPGLPRLATSARLTRSGRLAVTARCRDSVVCDAEVSVRRGTRAGATVIARRRIRLGPGRRRVYALAIGRSVARAMRLRHLRVLGGDVRAFDAQTPTAAIRMSVRVR